MFNFWLISILITLISNYISNKMIKEKAENMGYIYKTKKTTKGELIFGVALNIIPFLNLIISLLNFALLFLKDETLIEFIKKSVHLPNDVKMRYERYGTNKKTIEEALILDGVDKEIIKEELKKINSYENGFATKEKGIFVTYLDDEPIFTEKDYKKAKALELAKELIFETECNIELTKEEKTKLLKEYKKVFFNEKNKKDDNITQKILKLSNKNN